MKRHDAFKTRMLAQVRQIRKYKEILEKQGRYLSIEEAAMEWINRYAAEFPPLSIRQ